MSKDLIVPANELPIIEVFSHGIILPKTISIADIGNYPDLLVMARKFDLPCVFVMLKLKKDADINENINKSGVVAFLDGASADSSLVLLSGAYIASLKKAKRTSPDSSYWTAVVETAIEDEYEETFIKKGNNFFIAKQFRSGLHARLYTMRDDILSILENGKEFSDPRINLLVDVYDDFENLNRERRDVIDELIWRIVQGLPHREASDLQRLIDERSLLKRIGTCAQMLKDNVEIISEAREFELAATKKPKRRSKDKDPVLSNEERSVASSVGKSDPELLERWDKYTEIRDFIGEDARNVILEDFKRLISYGGPQGNSYEWPKFIRRLDFILGLPWKEESVTESDILKVGSVLDEDHYGLNYVKDQICDSIAPKILNPEGKGHILCFVGPPGVGKTSLAKSIARALNRKYVRMSVGGIKDESQIRGHGVTYIGSEPGEILRLMKGSGVRNPVFVVDEIDKLGHMSSNGDPSSAMLEVFDPEQNSSFKDHYASCGFDLSRVMFIATANVEEDIIPPLRDRMDIIRLPGYLEVEKVEIAKRYLVSRCMHEVGLAQRNVQVEWSDDILAWIIRGYTSEAGVRSLERILATVLRKISREYLESLKDEKSRDKFVVDHDCIYKYLGPVKVFKDRARVTLVGEAIGLAWTPVGGDILYIQATTYARVQDKKVFARTGMQGEVMKESDEVALTILRNDAVYDPNVVKILSESGMHLHIPEGAVPKDGPSAGITIEVAMYSATRNKLVRPFVAMTGEIDLMKRVLPVGGIREKIVAAERAGIKEIIMPKDNERNLHDVPKEVKDKLKFHFVENVDEAIKIAFGKD